MSETTRSRTVVSGKTLAGSDVERSEGNASKPRRRFGTMAGQIAVADDFDSPLPPDLQRAFDGDDGA